MKEPEEQIGTATQASKATIEHGANFFFTCRASVFETLLDISMTIFFWVELRSVGRQFFNQDFRMFLKVGFGDLAQMNTGSIPNQNDSAWYLPLNMLECFHHVFAFHRTFKMAFVDVS